MVQSIFFLVALIAVAIVIHWAITNDKTPPEGQTHGLLAMKDEKPFAARQQHDGLPTADEKLPPPAGRNY